MSCVNRCNVKVFVFLCSMLLPLFCHHTLRAQKFEFYRSSQASWDTTKAPMPIARQGHASFVHNGKIFIIGGFSRELNGHFVYYNELDIYDPETDSWDTSRTTTHIQRAHLNTCEVEGKIYVMGGIVFDDNEHMYIYLSVDVYDPSIETWQSRANYPGKTMGHTCQIDGIIYVIGGVDEDYNPLTNAYKYDTRKDVWSRIGDLQIARFAHAVLSLDGKVYAIGGINNNAMISSGLGITSVEIYDPETDRWSEGTELPFELCDLTNQFVYNGEIYIIGGRKNLIPTIAKKSMLKYNPLTDMWTEFGSLPKGRTAHTMEVVNDKIFLFGGFNTIHGKAEANTWEYDLKPASIPNHPSKTISIFPNPSRDQVAIKTNMQGDYQVALTSLSGRQLFSGKFSGSDYKVDLSGLPEGFYFIIIKSNKILATHKVIKR